MGIEFNKNRDIEQVNNNEKSFEDPRCLTTLDNVILEKLTDIYKTEFHKAWLDSQKIGAHEHIRIPDLINNENYNLQYSSYFEIPKELQDRYYEDAIRIANIFTQCEELNNNEIEAIKNAICSFLTDHCSYYMYHEVWKCDGATETSIEDYLSRGLGNNTEYIELIGKRISDLAEKIHEKWMLSNSTWAKDRYEDYLVPFRKLSECNKASYLLGAILAYDITKRFNEFKEFLCDNYGTRILISSDLFDQEFKDKIENNEVNKEQIINEFLRCLDKDQLEAICKKIDVLESVFNSAEKKGISLIVELTNSNFIFSFTDNDDIVEIKKDYVSNTIEEDLTTGYLFYKHNKD